MDILNCIDNFEVLDEVPVKANESLEELEQSILSLFAEDDLNDTIIPNENLSPDNHYEESSFLSDASTSPNSIKKSNNKTFLHDSVSPLRNIKIKRSLDKVVSPAPFHEKPKTKIPSTDNMSNVKSPVKLKRAVFDQKENISIDIKPSLRSKILCNKDTHSQIRKSNKNNFKNASGNTFNKISILPFKLNHSNFLKSPSKYFQENDENISSCSALNYNESTKSSCFKKQNLLSSSPPFSLHIFSDIVDQSSETSSRSQTSHKNLSKKSEKTENHNSHEKTKDNSTKSLWKPCNVQTNNAKAHQTQKNSADNDDDLLLFSNDDAELVVEEELDGSLLFDDNTNDEYKSTVDNTLTSCSDSVIIVDEWTPLDLNKFISVNDKKPNTFTEKDLAEANKFEEIAKVTKVEQVSEVNEVNSVKENIFKSSIFQPLSNEEIKKTDSLVDKPVKQYLLPFKSKDPEENNDIEHPDWDSIRKLTTDEERYKDVGQRWKSKVPPNTNRNLTYHSYRKRRLQDRTHLLSVKSELKKGQKRTASEPISKLNTKRARTKTVPCTFLIDNKIIDVKQQFSEESKAVKEEYVHESQSLFSTGNRNCTMQNEGYNFDGQRRDKVKALLLQREEKIKHAQSAYNLQLNLLHSARDEINQVCNFYKGLRKSSNKGTDPTLLTEKQMKELMEMENVYKQFLQHYATY